MEFSITPSRRQPLDDGLVQGVELLRSQTQKGGLPRGFGPQPRHGVDGRQRIVNAEGAVRCIPRFGDLDQVARCQWIGAENISGPEDSEQLDCSVDWKGAHYLEQQVAGSRGD